MRSADGTPANVQKEACFMKKVYLAYALLLVIVAMLLAAALIPARAAVLCDPGAARSGRVLVSGEIISI
jgi:hypothetical protein